MRLLGTALYVVVAGLCGVGAWFVLAWKPMAGEIPIPLSMALPCIAASSVLVALLYRRQIETSRGEEACIACMRITATNVGIFVTLVVAAIALDQSATFGISITDVLGIALNVSIQAVTTLFRVMPLLVGAALASHIVMFNVSYVGRCRA